MPPDIAKGTTAALRREDYEAAHVAPAVHALSGRVRCVLDPEIEAGTNTEEEEPVIAFLCSLRCLLLEISLTKE